MLHSWSISRLQSGSRHYRFGWQTETQQRMLHSEICELISEDEVIHTIFAAQRVMMVGNDDGWPWCYPSSGKKVERKRLGLWREERDRKREGDFPGTKLGKRRKIERKKKKINFWAVDLSLKRSNDVSSLSHLRNTVSPSHFRTRLECSRTSSVHSSSTHNNDLTHNVVVHSFSKASAWIVAACSYAISTTTLSSSSWALFTF